MIYLLTNVANSQDVPLDGTIFFGNTDQKDKATFMNKKVPIEFSPKLVETCRNPVLHRSLTIKARGDVHANKCCYNRGTEREYSSKPLKHSIVKRILEFNS